MQILVVGDIDQFEEIKLKFGARNEYMSIEDSEGLKDVTADLIFDFAAEDDPESLENYENTECPIFFSIAKTSLSLQNIFYPLKENWFGFNGLPTFINRPVLEVCVDDPGQIEMVSSICKKLETDFVIVDDRVGLVTPRVVCMIINEAYFTFGEGTASKEDIDQAMKLGTNYPFGPFEWASRIGIDNVYEVLEAVFDETKDERYKIAPQLRKEYLKIQ